MYFKLISWSIIQDNGSYNKLNLLSQAQIKPNCAVGRIIGKRTEMRNAFMQKADLLHGPMLSTSEVPIWKDSLIFKQTRWNIKGSSLNNQQSNFGISLIFVSIPKTLKFVEG